MIRSAASKAMSVGRFASAVFGLALVVGLTVGAASVALGANGGNFILGQNNVASALTKLTGNVNGAAMQVQNNNPGPNDQALSLAVQEGEAPMRVNSDARVANLNSDKIDGKDSAAFLGVDAKARDAARADFADFAGEAQNAQVAADANNLDGRDSTAFFSGEVYSKLNTAQGPGSAGLKEVTVQCDPGDVLLGGGGGGNAGISPDQDEDELLRSQPQSNLRDWNVVVRDNGLPDFVTVRVLCADFPPLRP